MFCEPGSFMRSLAKKKHVEMSSVIIDNSYLLFLLLSIYMVIRFIGTKVQSHSFLFRHIKMT